MQQDGWRRTSRKAALREVEDLGEPLIASGEVKLPPFAALVPPMTCTIGTLANCRTSSTAGSSGLPTMVAGTMNVQLMIPDNLPLHLEAC